MWYEGKRFLVTLGILAAHDDAFSIAILTIISLMQKGRMPQIWGWWPLTYLGLLMVCSDFFCLLLCKDSRNNNVVVLRAV